MPKSNSWLFIILLSTTFIAFAPSSSSAATDCSQDNGDVTLKTLNSHSPTCDTLHKIRKTPANTADWCAMAVGNHLCKNLTDTVKVSGCIPAEKFATDLEAVAQKKLDKLMEKCTKQNTVPPFSGSNPFWRQKK